MKTREVLAARCSDAGGLWLEGLDHGCGAVFFYEVRHYARVDETLFDFSNCAFGPGAEARLAELVKPDAVSA